MQRYQNTAQDALGNIIQGMTVSVFLTGTQTLASLFSDNVATPKPNPTQTDALGNFFFYAANGRYDVQLAKTGLPTTTTPDVLLLDIGGGGGAPLVAGQILFGAAGNTLAQDANLFWDNTNKRLGVGNAAPTQTLDVTGTGKFSTSVVTTSVLSGGVANINVGGGGGNWVFDGASGSLYPGSGLSGLVDIGKASTNLVRSGFFGTSVVTPQVTSAGQLNLAANNTVAWIILGGGNAALAPAADNILKLGDPTLRIATVFSSAIDSGSAASLILQPNATPTLKIVAVGSTNFANVQGAATPFAPVIFANGGDANIGLIFSSKGTGSLDFATEGTFTGDINSGRVIQFRVIDTPGATRFLTATGSNGGNPTISTTAGAIAFGAALVPTATGTIDLGSASNGWKRLYMDFTNTGTVGNVTINKPAGRVNLAAAGTTLTLTNSLITAASKVLLQFASAPGNAVGVDLIAVPAAGSCAISVVPAVTSQTAIDFVVINAD
jgi:hypothetical protein